MHSMTKFAVLEGNQETIRATNNNKQPCSCQTSLRNLLFHLVQRISLHFKSTDLYLFCTTKVFPKFLLPFQSQASFQSEQFGSYDYAARSLSLVACSLTSQRSRMLMQKRPLLDKTIVRDLKSDLHDTSFQSSPHCSSQEPFAYNESLQNPTIAVR